MAIQHSDALASHVLTAGFKNAFDGTGVIRIYTGSAPADANAAITGTLLSTLTLAATSFGTPSATARVLTAAAIASDVSAAATGTAGYFRVKFLASDADTNVNTLIRLQGTVGTSGTDMVLNSTAITVGGTVSITSWTYTFPA